MAPHAPYTCDDDFLRACVREAHKLGVGIHIHVSENMDQTRVSLERRGITPIQVIEQVGLLELPTILAHVKGALPEDIEILRRYPTGIAHSPKTYLKLVSGVAPLIEFRQAGIPVGLATDGAASNSTLDLWESLRLMPLVQKSAKGSAEVMTIAESLYIATRESARVFGLPDQLGSIEPGYLADIILVDLSGLHHQPLHNVGASLVYNTRASDVQTVIVDGKTIMRDRQLLTIDKAEIIANVRANMERLAQRLPENRIQVYDT
jgi:5-methylthioadenosine/S-adenosylhomocysteine deaminase